ncbi:hypothetical protein ILUMI_01488 [Ignelater luminosus]|uniref:Uncharacterized protein n=1 Tax=Ignelater luminosus TaxID=2038154 RepID=A0A8K0DJL7_IGNLU|nr:hypothetical protein ILUMI_01488 [Ignelater luminosus]
MSSGRYPRGLPPQCPSTPRRGSNSPISPVAVHSTPSVPNRSRSLDGLLDSEPLQTTTANSEQTPSENAQKSQSCDNNLDKKISDENIHVDKETEKLNDRNSNLSNTSSNKTQNLESSLDDSLDSNDINTKSSDISLHSNSSDNNNKQKRKFVNRCVNKVRSLIKK